MEAQVNFVVGDRDVGSHIDQVAEDLASLSIVIPAHTAGHYTIEAAGDPIYGWFTEGFDTPVLQDTKALLDELA
jgi:hypothetical protein